MNKDWIQFFHHNNRDFKPRMLSVAEERCPVALFKCFCRAKTSTITRDGVPWVPEVFFFLLFVAKIEQQRVGEKNPLVTALRTSLPCNFETR